MNVREGEAMRTQDLDGIRDLLDKTTAERDEARAEAAKHARRRREIDAAFLRYRDEARAEVERLTEAWRLQQNLLVKAGAEVERLREERDDALRALESVAQGSRPKAKR